MISKNEIAKYKILGINAMARLSVKGWFPAHLGAAILSALFFIEEFEPDAQVQTEIKKWIDGKVSQNPEVFASFPSEAWDYSLKLQLENAVSKNADSLRNSGHGVIFGTIVLKLLHTSPDCIEADALRAIITLLNTHTLIDIPQRYYGIENYFDETEKITSESEKELGTSELAQLVLTEISPLYPDTTIENRRYFFTGEKEHAVTHAHAVVLLQELGYADIASKAQKNVMNQLHFHRVKPPSEIQAVSKPSAELQPLKAEYWAQNFKDDHGYKIPWSAFRLLKEIHPSDRQGAEQNLAMLLSTIR